MDPISDTMLDWARRLLNASTLPETRWVERIWLVEPGAICYVSRAPYQIRGIARTALVKNKINGEMVYRVLNGWPCLEAGRVFQGPVQKQEKKAA